MSHENDLESGGDWNNIWVKKYYRNRGKTSHVSSFERLNWYVSFEIKIFFIKSLKLSNITNLPNNYVANFINM